MNWSNGTAISRAQYVQHIQMIKEHLFLQSLGQVEKGFAEIVHNMGFCQVLPNNMAPCEDELGKLNRFHIALNGFAGIQLSLSFVPALVCQTWREGQIFATFHGVEKEPHEAVLTVRCGCATEHVGTLCPKTGGGWIHKLAARVRRVVADAGRCRRATSVFLTSVWTHLDEYHSDGNDYRCKSFINSKFFCNLKKFRNKICRTYYFQKQ